MDHYKVNEAYCNFFDKRNNYDDAVDSNADVQTIADLLEILLQTSKCLKDLITDRVKIINKEQLRKMSEEAEFWSTNLAKEYPTWIKEIKEWIKRIKFDESEVDDIIDKIRENLEKQCCNPDIWCLKFENRDVVLDHYMLYYVYLDAFNNHKIAMQLR